MNKRILGKTGIEVSEIGFGAWAIGGNKYGYSYGSTNDEESVQAIKKALDLGCNFFDTADIYGFGHSEELLGETLKYVRKKIILATKAGINFSKGFTQSDFSEKYIRFALKQSLKRLHTDYIDIYQLHNPSLNLIKKGKIFSILHKLKAEGQIRAIGLSILEDEEGIIAINNGFIDCLQVGYNILNRKAEKKLFDLALSEEIGVIAREPLYNGLLTGKYSAEHKFEKGDVRAKWQELYFKQLLEIVQKIKYILEKKQRSTAQACIQFVLRQPVVSTVITGIKTAEQAFENFNAASVENITLNEIEKIFQPS